MSFYCGVAKPRQYKRSGLWHALGTEECALDEGKRINRKRRLAADILRESGKARRRHIGTAIDESGEERDGEKERRSAKLRRRVTE